MLDLVECGNWIQKSSFQKICLQIPDHLMIHSVEIVSFLQNYSNAFLYVIGNISYDYCCSDRLSADRLQVDACIHFGHACLTCSNNLPTFYVFEKRQFNTDLFYKEFRDYFQDDTKKIILFYETSLAYIMEEIYETLNRTYQNLILSTLNCVSNMTFSKSYQKGCQTLILGRQYSIPYENNIDTYDAVFLGSNDKTLITLSMSLRVNACHYFDNFKLCKHDISNTLWLKRRNFLIEKIKDAETFGIVIASLNVEHYLAITEMLKCILKKVGKKTYTFNVGKITPTKLANFLQIDIFIAITCPESSLIDSRDYLKPIVTPFEVEMAFNKLREFSLFHEIDFKQILPDGQNYKEFEIASKPDISLACGRIRNVEHNHEIISNTLTHKLKATLISNEVNTNGFYSRTWNGLEQKLGENDVRKAETGRDGIPINYVNENL